jgi:hypothetical protein
LVDGSDVFTSLTAYNTINAIAQQHAAEIVRKKLSRTRTVADASDLMPLDMRVRILYNPNLGDMIFVMPRLVALPLRILAINTTAQSIVRARELGTQE